MQGAKWAIIDTETDGLFEPVHVVELSAQLMDGWEPATEPFRMLLNHNVAIRPEAVAIHGYTQEFLAQNGQPPEEVYRAFRAYVGDAPLVAHNLSFDWNRSLVPEWQRLGLAEIGRRGFCAMMLSRRAAGEAPSHALDSLKDFFSLSPSQSHRALNDVLALTELFTKVLRPRLESARLVTFDDIASFTKTTPVAKCRALIANASATPSTKVALADASLWYYLDDQQNVHGPRRATEIIASLTALPPFVWQEGMPDWLPPGKVEGFPELVDDASSATLAPLSAAATELIGLCRGLVADDRITTAEVKVLSSWLEQSGSNNEWPISEIAQLVEQILEDGTVTMEEKAQLKSLIDDVLSNDASAFELLGDQDGPAETVPEVVIAKADFYVHVELKQGSRDWLEWRREGIGASDAAVIMGENPWKDADELLMQKCDPAYSFPANKAMIRGTKLEPAARRAYSKLTGRDVRSVCLQSSRYPWMRASLDGLSACGRHAVEIKCGASAYNTTATSKSPPSYYYAQLQHTLAVTGLDGLDFCCYWPGMPEIVLRVQRDNEYILRLLEAEALFWQRVLSARSHPAA
jgi:putative phage-type endonuclease